MNTLTLGTLPSTKEELIAYWEGNVVKIHRSMQDLRNLDKSTDPYQQVIDKDHAKYAKERVCEFIYRVFWISVRCFDAMKLYILHDMKEVIQEYKRLEFLINDMPEEFHFNDEEKRHHNMCQELLLQLTAKISILVHKRVKTSE